MTLQTEGEAEDEDVPTLYETFWPLLFLRRRLRDGKARYRHLERLYGHTIIFPHEPVHRPVHRFAHGNIDDVFVGKYT